MNKITNKKLDNKLGGLAEELNQLFIKNHQKPIRRYRIKLCNNQACLKDSNNVVGYLKGKRKNIPVCGGRNFCPDAHYRYFNYMPEYIKKENLK